MPKNPIKSANVTVSWIKVYGVHGNSTRPTAAESGGTGRGLNGQHLIQLVIISVPHSTLSVLAAPFPGINSGGHPRQASTIAASRSYSNFAARPMQISLSELLDRCRGWPPSRPRRSVGQGPRVRSPVQRPLRAPTPHVVLCARSFLFCPSIKSRAACHCSGVHLRSS